ncbi:hypothetical protein H7R52_06965 [Weissella confusa]|uniref:Tex protein YqgF-like domain-containing protein n=1 Tax=Weissella confusa TaxID=1583 RepID=A0A923NDG2_WEICO|nr:hypothetical protein [Weissella confusa]
MAELIKIDPQAVGVGQYQHDLPTKELETELDAVLETAVNQVGVNLNTASPQLLTHIAGLTKTNAIGNGTASRESQSFVADIIKSDLPDLQYVVVNESGASVYSASDMARAEFPDLQVEQRSAISIARR